MLLMLSRMLFCPCSLYCWPPPQSRRCRPAGPPRPPPAYTSGRCPCRSSSLPSLRPSRRRRYRSQPVWSGWYLEREYQLVLSMQEINSHQQQYPPSSHRQLDHHQCRTSDIHQWHLTYFWTQQSRSRTWTSRHRWETIQAECRLLWSRMRNSPFSSICSSLMWLTEVLQLLRTV